MRKLGVLIGINLKALLSALKMGSGKKAKATGMGAMILLGVLAVYIAGIYSFTFAMQLSSIGMLDYLIPMMAILGCLLSVVMTVQAASGFIFSGRDTDLLLSLPVSAFSVMLARITALYIENLAFIGLFMLTSGVAGAVKGLGGVGYYLTLAVGTLLLTFLATMVTMVLSFIAAFVTSRFPNHSLFSTIIYFAFLLLVMAGSFQISNVGGLLLTNKEKFDQILNGALLPFGLLKKGLDGDLLSLGLLVIVCIVPFLLLVWLFSSRYKQVLSALASRIVRNDYRLGALSARGQFSALFSREVKRYFGCSIYLFNTGFGAVLLLAGAIYGAVMHGKAEPYLQLMGGMEVVVPIAAIALGFIVATIDTTCVSISLEGKTFWIIKEAPVQPRAFFGAKVLLNLLIAWPATLISCLILGIAYGIAPWTVLALAVTLMALSMLIALGGLCINLFFPRMDAPNDTIVVKQSASAFIGVFGGWVPLGAACLGYLPASHVMGFEVYCLICTVVFLLASAGIWQWLKNGGVRRLSSI